MQFRSLAEFIVSVYGRAEQSAIWLSGQTLRGPEKKGGTWQRGPGFVHCCILGSLFFFFVNEFNTVNCWQTWAVLFLTTGTIKIKCLHVCQFIVVFLKKLIKVIRMAQYDTILHVFSCVYMVTVVVGGVPASSTLDSKAINSVILYLRSFFKTYRPPTCWLLYWYRSGQSVEPLVHLGQKWLIGIYPMGGDGGGRHKQRLNETESCRYKGIREQEAQCQFIRYSVLTQKTWNTCPQWAVTNTSIKITRRALKRQSLIHAVDCTDM